MSKKPFPTWVALSVLAAIGTVAPRAAETPAPAEGGATPLTLSSVASAKRAKWQERLTLGPGDTLNLTLFEMPETARTEVPIGPDGRISFLQAREVMAAGLTIDELRTKLDEALAKYYQRPRTIITPAAYHSKRYYVLGAVVNKGVFTFERSLTVIEAIGRAGGLETGLYENRDVELADLSHSFLSRGGKRMPVDFDRLFRHGDLSQNITLEPDDYLYFPLDAANEIYVLGEVMSPGVLTFAPQPTAVRAIAARGGFAERAFKSRVLVVRGSLNRPETFVVDTADILAGKAPDFKLQPKDIVYVSTNPWRVAVDVLDAAARAFVQGLTVEGSTLRIPAAIK